jgi:hypothetical protein
MKFTALAKRARGENKRPFIYVGKHRAPDTETVEKEAVPA